MSGDILAPGFAGTSCQRELRALMQLLRGPASREELDRACGASNSPDVIMRVRSKGLPSDTCLPCEKRKGFDKDGKSIRFGVYHLTEEGRARVLAWLMLTGHSLVEQMGVAASGFTGAAAGGPAIVRG